MTEVVLKELKRRLSRWWSRLPWRLTTFGKMTSSDWKMVLRWNRIVRRLRRERRIQVARITLWDGSVFYTNNWDFDHLRAFFANARQRKYTPDSVALATARIDVIEMTPEEYQAIPATQLSSELFDR